MLSTLANKVLIGGTIVLVGGIGGFIAGSMPPPRDSNSLNQIFSQSDNHVRSSDLSMDIKSLTHHERSTSEQSHPSLDSLSRVTDTQSINNRHCIVLLKSSSNSNHQILVCDYSEKHLDLSKISDLTRKNWYLYDSSKNTFDEINGFLTPNIKAERYWNWRIWTWQDWYPLPNKEDNFWREKRWIPYFRSGLETKIFGMSRFDLPAPSEIKEFSYWNTLNTKYSGKCGWGKSRSCSEFQLSKYEFTNLSKNLQVSGEKICLTLQKTTGNKWIKKENCFEIKK